MEDMEKLLRESESRMIAYFEAAIVPKFDLLADGHKQLLETMTPKTETEKLKEEIDFLRSIIRIHTREINELKKAL